MNADRRHSIRKSSPGIPLSLIQQGTYISSCLHPLIRSEQLHTQSLLRHRTNMKPSYASDHSHVSSKYSVVDNSIQYVLLSFMIYKKPTDRSRWPLADRIAFFISFTRRVSFLLRKLAQYCVVIAMFKLFGWYQGDGILLTISRIFLAEVYCTRMSKLLLDILESICSEAEDEPSEDHLDCVSHEVVDNNRQ